MRNIFNSVFGRHDEEPPRPHPDVFASYFSNPPQPQRRSGPPPASKRAIRQLPTIEVTPEDLVEESNRECCVCLEENHLKDHVTRLPCAHIYHPHCILDWLSKHCTCPVCRFELPTDDAQYEILRKQRMQHRKPRFARYELERMSVSDLNRLASKLKIDTSGAVVKQDLIHTIIDSGKIDFVVAPKPVEYPLSLLNSLGVAELRRTMASAGVFFDPKDVLEKQDMVEIFVNSGRLELLPEEEAAGVPIDEEECDKKPAAVQGLSKRRKRQEPMVETVLEDSDDEENIGQPYKRSNSSDQYAGAAFMDYDPDFVGGTHDVSQRVTATESQTVPLVDSNQVTDSGESSPREGAGMAQERRPAQVAEQSSEPEVGTQSEAEEPAAAEVAETLWPEADMEEVFDIDGDVIMEDASSESGPTTRDNDQETLDARVSEAAQAQFQERSISELREMARERRVDISDCIERSEMVDRLVANASTSFPQVTHHHVDVDVFDSCTVSVLRGIARALGVDLSQCTDRTDMVEQLVAAAEANQHIGNYLATLTPLMQLSVSELRAVAREWHINVNDCLEKEEMIDRLVVAGGPHTI